MTTRGPRVGVSATRGVSAGDPRPPVSSANAARACLEHLCACLRALGVGTSAGASRDATALTAETLRRAKFDQPAAVAPLWRALHDLFLVAHAGFPEPSVAAETLRALRDETVNRHQEDDIAADETSRDENDENNMEKEHARVARRFLRLAKYPRMHELFYEEKDDVEFRGSSRKLLVALAWAACELEVHARAHADRCAPLLRFETPTKTVDDETAIKNLGGSSLLLPPYGSDAAASPASAEAHAAIAVAAERAYLRDAAERTVQTKKKASSASRADGRASHASPSRDVIVLEKQAGCLAQRVWQSVSHVHALERARAARRIAIFDAQTKATRDTKGRPRRVMTATEIRLAKDAKERGRAVAAMRAVLATKDNATETVALAETFWAWMRSVLELDEKEKNAKTKNAEKKTNTETKMSALNISERFSGDDGASLTNLSQRLSSLEMAARRVGPSLRLRRKDVETVARTWRKAREATRENDEEHKTLSSLAIAAAARTPSLASFEAGARAKIKMSGEDGDENGDTSSKTKTTRERPSSFAYGCSVIDDAPAPPGVAEALITRGGFVGDSNHRTSSNFEGVDGDETNATTESVEKTNDDEDKQNKPRFGSSLLSSSKRFVSIAKGETCLEAVNRLRLSLNESEALLETQRARAVDALREKVTRAFLNGDATRVAPVAVHGWDR